MTVFEKIKVIDLEETTELFIAFGMKILYDLLGEKAVESFVKNTNNYISVQEWLKSEVE